MKRDWTVFKELIEDQHEWPGHYTFKFIIKSEHLGHIKTILSEFEIEEKQSSNGKYVSLTIIHFALSSEEVVGVYRKLEGVEGLISL